MKLSKYAALVRREAFCHVIHIENEGMWLGARGVLYRASELPECSGPEQVQAILSLSDKQMEKVVVKETDCESVGNVLGYDLHEYTREQVTRPVDIVAMAKGIGEVCALKTSDGELLFYNNSYLAPIEEDIKGGYMEMTARRHANGTWYIAVKNGMNVLAIIMPVKLVGPEFIGKLQDFEALCTEQLLREQKRAEEQVETERRAWVEKKERFQKTAAEDEPEEEDENQMNLEEMDHGTDESD